MKDQNDKIKNMLVEAISLEVGRLEDKGNTRTEIAKLAGVRLPFLSNFMSQNEAGMNGLSIPKLISMANGLGLKLDISITRGK